MGEGDVVGEALEEPGRHRRGGCVRRHVRGLVAHHDLGALLAERLEHGWVHSGKSKEDLERNRKRWFDYHGDRAEAIREILSPDIITFLERAYVVDCEGGHAFFYYVGGLFSPSLVHEISETFNHGPSEDNMLQNIVLYNMNSSFGSHPVGLV